MYVCLCVCVNTLSFKTNKSCFLLKIQLWEDNLKSASKKQLFTLKIEKIDTAGND